MVEPLYIKEASYVIFIHAKFKNYSRTELLFSLANHLNGSFFILERKLRCPRLFWIKMRTENKFL